MFFLVSRKCFSVSVHEYFQVSLDFKVILYVAKITERTETDAFKESNTDKIKIGVFDYKNWTNHKFGLRYDFRVILDIKSLEMTHARLY